MFSPKLGADAWIDRIRQGTPPFPLPLPRCAGLSPDERLVVAALRQIVVAGLGAPGLEAAFELRCGPDGRAVAAALREWIALLSECAARQIAVASPQHCCPSPDEIAMLAIVAGARRGDFAQVHRLLAGLVRPARVDTVAHAAEILGDALHDAGLALQPRRLREAAPRDTAD